MNKWRGKNNMLRGFPVIGAFLLLFTLSAPAFAHGGGGHGGGGMHGGGGFHGGGVAPHNFGGGFNRGFVPHNYGYRGYRPYGGFYGGFYPYSYGYGYGYTYPYYVPTWHYDPYTNTWYWY